MDNASIHKTLEIQKFIRDNNLHAITIAPYSPALNAAELVIQVIKAKVAKRRGKELQAIITYQI